MAYYAIAGIAFNDPYHFENMPLLVGGYAIQSNRQLTSVRSSILKLPSVVAGTNSSKVS